MEKASPFLPSYLPFNMTVETLIQTAWENLPCQAEQLITHSSNPHFEH